ncbi:MAG: hypothetical protein JST68_19135 [Bacteroidetes bacterium]|nr:hypothetical protein [Bacteroidota bacterium]
MHLLAFYLIKAVGVSGILYGYYMLVLRNKKFHVYNRFFLLGSMVVSLVVSLVNIKVNEVQPAGRLFVPVLRVAGGGDSSSSSSVGWEWGIAVVSFFLLCKMLFKIGWIYRVKRDGVKSRRKGFTFIETSVRQAPFSFLNNLFWREGMPMDEKIYTHELAHIRQGHTYDKLFTQAVTCVCWMNPFYWLIQGELNALHEFMADSAAIEDGDGAGFAEMLLRVHDGGRYLSGSNSFFHPSIKRRLFMITTSSKASYAYTRRIMALVVGVVVFGFFSVSLKAQDTVKVIDHIEIHGQTGIGDTAIVYFKDGAVKRFLMNDPAQYKVFKEKYEPLLPHPAGPDSKVMAEARPYRELHEAVAYEPLAPIPAQISRITFGPSKIWLTLTNGKKEQYDLTNADEVKNFESKYGKLKVK